MALDGTGRYCWLDPRLGAQHAVAEACRNVSATGAEPVAATNCLNFGNPEKPEIMWQFAETVAGMGEACAVLGTPITGGNVSFYNETQGEPIHPTPVVGVVGFIEDAAKAVGGCFRGLGRVVVLLGGRQPGSDREIRFGSTEYAKTVLGATWGLPPALDLEHEKRVQACCRELVKEGIIESAHDVSDGGLAAALAECCFGGVGVRARVDAGQAALALFGEEPSRYVVSLPEERLAALGDLAAQYRVEATPLGVTEDSLFHLEVNGQPAVRSSVAELREVWETALEKLLTC